MAKQTFTTGQVLTAAQMTSLQQTAMGGGSTTAKTTSYVLLAADAGTVVQMNSSSATTITVNQNLFAAGDSVQIQNMGSGVCTVTAGTATVSTAGSLALSQYEGGQLYFNTTSAALFLDIVQSAAAGGKVLQVVYGSTSTAASNSTTTFADTNLTATITPTLNTSKVLIMCVQQNTSKSAGNVSNQIKVQLLRGATVLGVFVNGELYTGTAVNLGGHSCIDYLDSPATTAATTYKTQFANAIAAAAITVQDSGQGISTIMLLEIGA